MACIETTAFWGMTINNYDENDLAMVQNGYPDHMRELIFTFEKGEEGTPHIQAWIKLQRQQRLAFVKKLFPRGNFTPLKNDAYVFNAKRYAQKLDNTAQSAAIHRFTDPIHTIESVIKRIVVKATEQRCEFEWNELKSVRLITEREMVLEDYRLAKIFVSSTYKQMWDNFGKEMWQNIRHTHTHTHSQELLSREGGITQDARDNSQEDCSQHSQGEDTEGDDFEESDSETDEGLSQSTSSGFDEEDD